MTTMKLIGLAFKALGRRPSDEELNRVNRLLDEAALRHDLGFDIEEGTELKLFSTGNDKLFNCISLRKDPNSPWMTFILPSGGDLIDHLVKVSKGVGFFRLSLPNSITGDGIRNFIGPLSSMFGPIEDRRCWTSKADNGTSSVCIIQEDKYEQVSKKLIGLSFEELELIAMVNQ